MPLRPPPMEAVRLKLLGEFTLMHGQTVLSVGLASQRLLAYLALQHGPVRRSQLADVLWLAGTTARASANLRAAVSRLPRPGGRFLIRAEPGHLRLTEDLEVDVVSAAGLIQDLRDGTDPASSGTLSQDLLPSWDDDWLVLDRERHRQMRLHALEAVADRLGRQGRFEEAVCVALSAVAGEPLRESAQRVLITTHLREGNQTEALRQYESYRRLLRDELGIGPGPALRSLVGPLLGRPADQD